jgi:hypothetical protein
MARTLRECGGSRFNPMRLGFSQIFIVDDVELLLVLLLMSPPPPPTLPLLTEAVLLDRHAFRLSIITIVDVLLFYDIMVDVCFSPDTADSGPTQHDGPERFFGEHSI